VYKEGGEYIDIRLSSKNTGESYRIQFHDDATIIVIDSSTGEELLNY